MVYFQNIPVSNSTKQTSSLPLKKILRLIEQMEAHSREAPLLSTLYNSLANAYQQRNSSQQDSELAIQAYEKAICLQRKLNFKTDLAETLLKQGNL